MNKQKDTANMIKVYHLVDETIARESIKFRFKDADVLGRFLNRYIHSPAYKFVATVETDDLDIAYRATNHIDSSWTENDDVEASQDCQFRSTDVCDLMIVCDAEGNAQRFYIVASCGFSDITDLPLGQQPG